jgi:hypothetical protein
MQEYGVRVRKARLWGTCRFCLAAVMPGQRIALTDSHGWIHVRCCVELAKAGIVPAGRDLAATAPDR